MLINLSITIISSREKDNLMSLAKNRAHDGHNICAMSEMVEPKNPF